jgi:hypothetical protein
MAAVADLLRGLPVRKTELRLHSEVRFLGAELNAIAGSLSQMHSEALVAADSAANEAKSYALVQDRLRALLGAARADLDKCIEEEVSASARRGAADVKELKDAVLARLEAALDRWEKEQNSALEALVREADAEMKVRRERPGWQKLSEVLNNTTAAPEAKAESKGRNEMLDKMQRVTKLLHKGFRESQPAMLGMSLEKARIELNRLKQAGSFEEYAKQARKGASCLRDAAHAKQARRALLIDTGFEVAVPALLELGGLLAEAWVEHKATEQRAARRAEVRRVIEDASKKLADRAWSLWREEGMPGALEAALDEARTCAEGAAASLKSKCNDIHQSLASVKHSLNWLQTSAQ